MTLFDKLRSVISFCDDNGRSDLGQVVVDALDELRKRPKWNGGFEAARQIAWDILADCPTYRDGDLNAQELHKRVAEALVEAFDNGVLAERLTDGTNQST